MPRETDRVMHQALITSPSRIDVAAGPIPELQDAGEILIRTAACGICSGDLMPWYLQKKVGTVLGHEVVGWAAEVGLAVTHIRPENLVFAHHHAPCRNCQACRHGRFVQCPSWRASRLDPGGMAEWIRVPAMTVQNDCFAINDLTVAQGIFIEPLGCCVKAWHQALPDMQPAADLSAAVVGCGVMGLLNLAVGKTLGVSRLIAIEPQPMRRRLALDFGADQVFSEEDVSRHRFEPVDIVIIGPGDPGVIHQSLTYLQPGGTAVVFTPTPTAVTTALDLGDLYFREIRLVPSYSCGPDDTRKAYQLLRERKVQPENLITHRFPLTDVQHAFDTARQGGPVLKVIVDMASH